MSVLRLKRKASSEPLEGLVVALKKSKFDEPQNSKEVYFKFAATLKSEKESIKVHIQAALSKEKDLEFSKWRDPKNNTVIKRNVFHICEKLKKESKAVSEKKRLDQFNSRRLIFTETFPIDDEADDVLSQNAEVRKLFQLYDIIEENEEPKKQADVVKSVITCNDEPLIREKTADYVYDFYITDGHIDDSFIENTVSLRPCAVTNDDIYSGDSDDSSEIYEDEDDSNDENNWRNEYPEDEDSHSEKDDSDVNDEDIYYDEIEHSFSRAKLEEDDFSSDDDDAEELHSKTSDIMQDDYEGSD